MKIEPKKIVWWFIQLVLAIWLFYNARQFAITNPEASIAISGVGYIFVSNMLYEALMK